MAPRLYRLPDGLRLLFIPSETRTAYAGILVAAGSRHQLDTESGMAHLVEHMSFKGTARRTATQIINRIETVGGELNAYTGKEETVYYATCLPEHLPRAIDLLRDIVFNSTYPEEELAREVEVVCDEIESYEDSPAELIYEDFEALLFHNKPLGRHILGDAERLRQYTSEDLRAFTRRHYRPENAILFILTNETNLPKNILHDTSTIEPSSPPLPGMSCIQPSSSVEYAAVLQQLTPPTIIHRSTHQAHVIIGAEAFPLSDPRHMAITLLNNILGGPGMNSRLNMSLRERRGLVYTVESSISAYTDTGVWTTYFGCDPHDVKRCLHLITTELRHLTDAPLSPRQLAAAKRQLCGQLTIAWENRESQAIGMTKRLQLTDCIYSLDENIAAIQDLTADALLHTARLIFSPEHLKTLIYDN